MPSTIVPTVAELSLIAALRSIVVAPVAVDVTKQEDLGDTPTDEEDTEKPVNKGKKGKTKPVEEPEEELDDEPLNEEETEGPDLNDFRKVIKKLQLISEAGKTLAKKVIAHFEAKSLDDFPEDKYAEGIKLAEKQIAKLSK
jgi:hypothetical protein